jgi:hypothetical protein
MVGGVLMTDSIDELHGAHQMRTLVIANLLSFASENSRNDIAYHFILSAIERVQAIDYKGDVARITRHAQEGHNTCP